MPTAPHGETPRSLKFILLLTAMLTIMAGTVVAPALPAIRQAFAHEANVDLLSRMVLTLPALFVAICAPIAGVLADRFGRRKLLIASVLLYAIAGTSGLVADNLTTLLAGRAALGLSIGGIMTIGAALVGDYFQGNERARFLGLQQAFTQLGGVVFVVGGGLLAEVHWRIPFLIYGLALPLALAAMFYLLEPKRAHPSDIGATMSSGGNWLMVALVCGLAFLVNALFYTVPVQLAFYLSEIGSARPSMAGFAIGALNLVAAMTALNYGRLRQSVSSTGAFMIGLTLLSFGFCGLWASSGLTGAFVALAVAGAGLGFVVPNIIATAIQLAGSAQRGRVAGLVTSSMFLGHFTSPIVSQPAIDRIGYAGAYLGVGLIFGLLAAAAIAVLVIQGQGKTEPA